MLGLACFSAAWGGCASPQFDPAFSRALSAQRQGHHQQAIALYRHLLQDDPKAEGAWHNLGVSLLVVGEHEQAADALEHAIAIDNGDLLARYLLALSFLQCHKPAEALIEVQQLRKLRDAKVDDTISRLGTPTYRGVDLRVVDPAFDEKLARIEDAARHFTSFSPPVVMEFASIRDLAN